MQQRPDDPEPEDDAAPACELALVEALSGDVPVSSVAAGSMHSAAVTSDGRLWTWGWGECEADGQRGGHGAGEALRARVCCRQGCFSGQAYSGFWPFCISPGKYGQLGRLPDADNGDECHRPTVVPDCVVGCGGHSTRGQWSWAAAIPTPAHPMPLI